MNTIQKNGKMQQGRAQIYWSAKFFLILILLIMFVPFLSGTAAEAQQIYWVDSKTNKIQRANRDGSDVQDVFTAEDDLLGVAVDEVGGKIYGSGAGVHRANIDGSDVELLIPKELSPNAVDIAVDASGGKIYWSHIGVGIIWANLDGSEGEVIVTTEFNSPSGIFVDAVGGKIYWTGINIDLAHVQK